MEHTKLQHVKISKNHQTPSFMKILPVVLLQTEETILTDTPQEYERAENSLGNIHICKRSSVVNVTWEQTSSIIIRSVTFAVDNAGTV
jgi:hypothetical protein